MFLSDSKRGLVFTSGVVHYSTSLTYSNIMAVRAFMIVILLFLPSFVLYRVCRACCDPFSLAVLIESLGCGTLPWRKEMEKGEGHGVRLVCDAVDSDIVITQDTVSFSFAPPS